ncbi:cytochrome P450 [Massarina eburnea CBS 473.64]|uniref:Cytochrome P450 n=1 Tax=Massarina eburnea CBS 473.64 TaxID=1395130 RepID=A0A6A6RUA5_9PLEO|nr:cytochrome P450 [Massarina eburnea CBS 473.64]
MEGIRQTALGLLKVGVAYIVFWMLRATYRLFFHPLARYPGSRLAAVSKPWYEWYWNFHHNGMMLFEIERLHKLHGPVVRIAPNELNVNDPEIFQEMTKVGSQFIKDPSFYHVVTFPGTSIGETDPSRSRIRRQVLAPAFSPARVQELIPMVKEKVDRLLAGFLESSNRSDPIDIFMSMKAFALDVISEIVLGKEFGCIEAPGYKNQFVEYLHSNFDLGWMATAFPNLTGFSLSLPEWLSAALFPIPIMDLKKKCVHLVDDYLRERDAPRVGVSDVASKKIEFNKSVVIDTLVDPTSAKDHSVLNGSQLADEIIMLLSAGTDTTSDVIMVCIYQSIKNASVHKKLTEELAAAFPTHADITYDKARKLPYLTAVIKESLRYSNPIPSKAPRMVPQEGWTLYGHKIPAKTVINTSSYLLNRHPSIWGQDAYDFHPERWLDSNAAHLDKYMTSFYRGSRQCLGKDLAFCEMYTLLANLFRQFELEMYNTTDDDMKWIDLLVTYFVGSKLHVKIKKRVD